MSDVPSHSTPSAPPSLSEDAALEPCPTPLEWQEVVTTFVAEAEHWYLDHDGERVRGRTWGSGPPLYFLNSLCGTHELFALLVWLLRDDFRCVLFDYPESRNCRLSRLADWIPRIAEHHQDRQLTLFAPGFGSLVAFEVAAKFPELISSLICPAASAGLKLSFGERFVGQFGRWVPGSFRRVPNRWYLQQRSHRLWFPPYDTSRFQFYIDNTGTNRTRAVAGRFLAGAQFDPEILSRVTQSVLLIRAEGDGPIQEAAAEKLGSLLPNSTSEWMHTTGVLSYLTHPHRLVKLIRAFCETTTTT
ncbi:MAG TPA: alpha/beta fold hydrolase [Planctomycetaceae bacterium]|nr:alpha/beta fold hydrolase [Planctomycetaceae bacterium]